MPSGFFAITRLVIRLLAVPSLCPLSSNGSRKPKKIDKYFRNPSSLVVIFPPATKTEH